MRRRNACCLWRDLPCMFSRVTFAGNIFLQIFRVVLVYAANWCSSWRQKSELLPPTRRAEEHRHYCRLIGTDVVFYRVWCVVCYPVPWTRPIACFGCPLSPLPLLFKLNMLPFSFATSISGFSEVLVLSRPKHGRRRWGEAALHARTRRLGVVSWHCLHDVTSVALTRYCFLLPIRSVVLYLVVVSRINTMIS